MEFYFRWECNIKMNLEEIGYEHVISLHLRALFFKQSSELIDFIHDGVTLCSELLFWTVFTVRIFMNRQVSEVGSLSIVR